MKIIKEGNLNKFMRVKRFVCGYCDCIFTANKDEYTVGSQYNEEYYYCKCPCCGNNAYIDGDGNE